MRSLRIDVEQVREAAESSTCMKRAVVCVLYDAYGTALVSASNRCDPPEGECARLGVASSREDYPAHAGCNTADDHAEARAVAEYRRRWQHTQALGPLTAVLLGHEWPCPHCAIALASIGVERIEVVPSGLGTGLKEVVA